MKNKFKLNKLILNIIGTHFTCFSFIFSTMKSNIILSILFSFNIFLSSKRNLNKYFHWFQGEESPKWFLELGEMFFFPYTKDYIYF